MKKNKRVIIITIIAIIVIITGIIVGISINNHNTAVKEALSVSESKEYVCDSFDDEYKSIVDKEYKTAEEYKSAKDNLIAIKDKINRSDIKEDERLVTIVSNIDKTIEEYDAKIKDLTTTTTESTTESTTETITKKEDKPVNATTGKSNNSSNNSTTKSNKSNNTTKATQPKTTAKQTTTKKSYDPDPAYGTIKYSIPTGNYKTDHWCYITVNHKWDGNNWNTSMDIGSNHSPCNKEDMWNQCYKAYPEPKRDGKYIGEEVYKFVYVWN